MVLNKIKLATNEIVIKLTNQNIDVFESKFVNYSRNFTGKLTRMIWPDFK